MGMLCWSYRRREGAGRTPDSRKGIPARSDGAALPLLNGQKALAACAGPLRRPQTRLELPLRTLRAAGTPHLSLWSPALTPLLLQAVSEATLRLGWTGSQRLPQEACGEQACRSRGGGRVGCQ